jgi:hypothetical protein
VREENSRRYFISSVLPCLRLKGGTTEEALGRAKDKAKG